MDPRSRGSQGPEELENEAQPQKRTSQWLSEYLKMGARVTVFSENERRPETSGRRHAQPLHFESPTQSRRETPTWLPCSPMSGSERRRTVRFPRFYLTILKPSHFYFGFWERRKRKSSGLGRSSVPDGDETKGVSDSENKAESKKGSQLRGWWRDSRSPWRRPQARGLAPEGGSSRGKGKPSGTAPRPALRSPRSAHPARPRAQGPAAPSSRTVPHPTPGDTTARLWLPEARRRKPNVLRGHFAKG